MTRDFVIDRRAAGELLSTLLGRTIARWTPQITNWHISRVTNGPTEALNNLIKRIKRAAFGFRNFLRELPNPRPPLRWETQLGPTRIGHSPLKSDDPHWGRKCLRESHTRPTANGAIDWSRHSSVECLASTSREAFGLRASCYSAPGLIVDGRRIASPGAR